MLDGEQLALQIHESIGHALELDRILLGEASYAGTSWVGPDDIGSARFGSEHMTITADATQPGRSARSAGTTRASPRAATRSSTAGLLRATLSNRESAAAIGLDRSGGCARADGFARQPIVRMTNVSIEPGGAGSLEDLIADTDEGVYLETNRSWSIDDRRLQFQFGTEIGREIKGGRLGRLYRNPSYAGIGPRFWGSLDAVCGAEEWRAWGLTNCGKGEPGQVMSRLARRGAGAVPRRPGRRGVSRPSRPWSSPSARSGTRRARRRPRSRASARCCRASPARARRRRRRSTTRRSRSSASTTGTPAARTRTTSPTRACATPRRAPTRARERPPRRPAGGASTRASPSRGTPRAHHGFDAATAALDPAVAGDALRVAFAAVRRARPRGVRHLDGRRRRDGDRVVGRGARARRGHRRVHEGHRARRRRAQRLGLGRGGRGGRDRPGGDRGAGRRQGPDRGAGRPPARPSTRSSSSPRPSASCSTSSATSRSTASPTPRAAARSSAASGSASRRRRST